MPATEKLQFARFDASKFPKQLNRVSGTSPYATTNTEGPSYQNPDSRTPIPSTGKLEAKYAQFASDLTPLLGREYSSNVKITSILEDEDLLRDLAVLIAQKGVVFFRGQDDLSVDAQKLLVQKLGELSLKPKTSGLHIHPIAPAGGVIRETGVIDPEVSFISSHFTRKGITDPIEEHISKKDKLAGDGWHSDISFEPVPSDFTSLKVLVRPDSGGDTLWANGYALLEKFSPSFQDYLASLTGVHIQPKFSDYGLDDLKPSDFYSDARGAPENVGDELLAHHPLVRTNPVTGWKSLYAIGAHFGYIKEVSPIESSLIKKFIHDTPINSHDIQVRFKWASNDVAIWDNRSTFHAATQDFLSFADREGVRTVGVGERPYLDPKSTLQSSAFLQ